MSQRSYRMRYQFTGPDSVVVAACRDGKWTQYVLARKSFDRRLKAKGYERLQDKRGSKTGWIFLTSQRKSALRYIAEWHAQHAA